MSSHPTPRRSTRTQVRIGHDDSTLTGHAGLLLTGELVRRLQVVETIEDAVNRVRPFKQRQRGLNAGELMVALAETVMVGGDHLVHLDQLRGDLAGAELRAVSAPPAPTTAGQLLKRFQVGQCRAVVAAMAELGNRFDRQMELSSSAPVTLDMDGTLSEVYGWHKEMACFNREGRRGFLSVFVTSDERRRHPGRRSAHGLGLGEAGRGRPAPASAPGAAGRPRSRLAAGGLRLLHGRAAGDLPAPPGRVLRLGGADPSDVPADDLDAGMILQPRGQCLGRAVRQHVDRAVRLHVHEHRAVGMAAPQRELIDTNGSERTERRFGQIANQTERRRSGPAGIQPASHPLARRAAEGQSDIGEDRLQPRAAAPVRLGQAIDLLGEDPSGACGVPAEETPDP